MSSAVLPPTLLFHNNGGTFPPHGIITPNDHGPYVVVTTWTMVSLSVLALSARLGTRRMLGADNAAISIATMVSIMHSVTIHLAVNNGLGRRANLLTRQNYEGAAKGLYASQILQIIILCLSKISLLLVYTRLTPVRKTLIVLWTAVSFVATWGIAAVIALAAQCAAPAPWDFVQRKCIHRSALHQTNCIVNLVTDVAIAILPALIVWRVSLRSADRWAVLTVFSSRLLVCASTIGGLISLRRSQSNPDWSWSIVTPEIWTQITINMSIITACIPLIKPFLEQLQFSLLNSSVAPAPWVQLQTYHHHHHHNNPGQHFLKPQVNNNNNYNKNSKKQIAYRNIRFDLYHDDNTKDRDDNDGKTDNTMFV